jgi:hypothetical protein
VRIMMTMKIEKTVNKLKNFFFRKCVATLESNKKCIPLIYKE